MRKFAVAFVIGGALVLISLDPVLAQAPGFHKHKGAAHEVPPASSESCAGIICDLMPESARTPFTASQAAEMQSSLRRTAQLSKSTKLKVRRLASDVKRKPSVVRADKRRRPVVQVAEAASPVVSDTQQGAPVSVVPEGGVAIFSLFDPVVEPANYGYWLRRVPRSKPTRQAELPSWAAMRQS